MFCSHSWKTRLGAMLLTVIAIGAGWWVLAAGEPVPGTEKATAFEASRAEQEADTRQVVRLPAPAREQVLKEMRQMLEALNGVLLAMVEGDRGAMAEAALSGGTAIAVDTDPRVAASLPREFVALGSSTHEDFDALAAAIEEGAGRDSVVAKLGSLTARCVSCHASYRVETPEAP